MDIKDYTVTMRCNKCAYSSTAASYGGVHKINVLMPYTKDIRVCPSCRSGRVTMAKASFTSMEIITENKERTWSFTVKCLKCQKDWRVRVSLFNSEEHAPNRPTATCPKCGETDYILYTSTCREK